MHASLTHRTLFALSALSLLLGAGLAAAGDGQGDAAAAFDRLKALEGTWHGQTHGTEDAEGAVTHVENLCVRFVDPESPAIPFKVKKGETPDTAPHGSIARKLLVERPWDAKPTGFYPPRS